MIAIFKLQLQTFYKSKTFIFVLFLLILQLVLSFSGILPEKVVLLSIIGSDIAAISFFQFGSDYGKFINSSLEKKIKTSTIDENLFKFVFLFFSIILIITIASLELISTYFISTLVETPLFPIQWSEFLWFAFFYWIIIYTILNLAFAYFIMKIIKNNLAVNSFFGAFLIILLLGGGSYSSIIAYDESGIAIKSSFNILIFFQHLIPQWYANQFIVTVMYVSEKSLVSSPFAINSYVFLDQYLFLFIPFLFMIFFFSYPKIFLQK